MNFDTFMTRVEAESVQELLGVDLIRVMRATSTKEFSLSEQRALLLEQMSPEQLLANKKSRDVLLDLLRTEEAQVLCRILRIDDAKPFSSLKRCRFGRENLKKLNEFFSVTPVEEFQEDVESHKLLTRVMPSYPLFAHQLKASNEALYLLRNEHRKVLLHMPTGSGKTRTALTIISNFLWAQPSSTILWLAHSEELCEQAASEFETAWNHLGSHEIRVVRYWGSEDLSSADMNQAFVVAGLQKLYSRAKSDIAFIGQLGSKCSLVVMDEAHQAVAPTYKTLLEALFDPFPSSSLLGLSATPGRTWDDLDADEELARFFGRSKVRLEIPGFDNPVDYLIENEYLAKPTFRSLLVNSGFNLTDSDRKAIQDRFEIPKSVMKRLSENEARNVKVIAEIFSLARYHKRIIVFAATVAHANVLAFTARANGLWSYAITGGTEQATRKKLIEEFQSDSNDVRVLINYGVLTTGFDAPLTSAALIARPTVSLVLYSQMVGRAMRGRRAGGNSDCEIVTVVDSALPGFGNVGEAFMNWEDIWE